MLFRKYASFLVAAAISVTAFSCDDDDDPIIDITDPEVIITSPSQTQIDAGFTQGETIEVRGSASDNGTLDFIELTVKAPDGSVWYTKDWTDINAETATISDDIVIPADAPTGTHTLEILVNDIEGNTETMEWTFEIMASVPDDNATFNITVPASTPDGAQVFLVGDMTGWGEDVDGEWELTDNGDGTYSGTFYIGEDMLTNGMGGFKFRIKTDDGDAWKFVEKGAECEEIDNRAYAYSADMQTLDLTVLNWRNLGDCPN